MQITTAEFVKSSAKVAECPKPDRPEYAFIGRSNVGKSSLINALTGNKKLAKISSTPGKTQLINHFLIDGKWFMVDLPGLGYAKISKTQRAKWEKMIYDYFLRRLNLLNTFILVDSRHSPQKIDLELMNWFGANQLPFVIVFTKADKMKPSALKAGIAAYKKRLLEDWEELPEIFITSSEKKTGLDDITSFIEKTNTVFDFNRR
jgi:GTP-binding protein